MAQDPRGNRYVHQTQGLGCKVEEEYLALLKSDKRFLNRDIVHVVEYDIGNEHEMTERRKRFEKEGFNVVPVFHPNDSKEYADMLIRDYDYVGIGGIAVEGGRYQAKDFQQYFKKMKENHTKVHGFGMTQQEPMRRMPFTLLTAPLGYQGEIWNYL